MHFHNRIALLLMLVATTCSTFAQAQNAAKPIPDEEPQVTQQLDAWLRQWADGAISEAALTDKARAAMGTADGVQARAALCACTRAAPLQLLARSVFGEDRRYRYRLVCKEQSLLVELALNKGARVDVLNVQVELQAPK
jgi:Spy/CpxP family protein refolding chaperone